ncbi:hypothetical protein [Streptomyces buecherae]|uniref:hypothetical protein n=1 Tax=Streptomyces buecherae TaxID=2763006 RepID=UPI00378D2EDB
MGKRERRRRREAAALRAELKYNATPQAGAGPETTEYLTPTQAEPALKIVLGTDAPIEAHEWALRYWSLEESGTWTNQVTDLEATGWTPETVSSIAYAQVLSLACGECGKPPEVRSRAEVDALQGTDRSAGTLCPECVSQPKPAIPSPTPSPEHQHDPPLGDDNAEEASQGEPSPLEIELLEGAPEELTAIAKQYWNLTYIEPESQYVVWSGPVKAIDTRGWGPAHIAAGAAVRAHMPGRSCRTCSGPLTFTSRTAFEQAYFGDSPPCVDCSPALLGKMLKLRAPSPAAKAPQREQATSRKVRHSAEDRWAEQQAEAIRDRHSVSFRAGEEMPTADVRTEASVLALLHYAPSTTPIEPTRLWGDPLDPDPHRSMGEILVHGFIRIHPDSPPSAFCWEPENFREAIAAAGGDIDAVPPPRLTNRYYAQLAFHYVPFGTSMGTATENLIAHLVKRLAPATFDQDRRQGFLTLVQELIAAEALRYFDLQLDKRHLPPIPDNHLARLKDVARRGSATLALGELNNLVWRAARSAADAAQRTPQAPRANMSTFALNCLETYVQQALTDAQPIKPYTFDPSLLAALTRTVFYTAINADPFTTSAPQVDHILPPPVPATASLDAGREDGEEARTDTSTSAQAKRDDELAQRVLTWLAEHRDAWTVQDFTDHLRYLQAQALAPRPTARQRTHSAAASSMLDLYHDLRHLLSASDQDVALTVCAAAQRFLNDHEQADTGASVVEQFFLRLMPDQESEATASVRADNPSERV